MDDNIRTYIARIRSRWRPFLEQLADAVHPHDSSRLGWGPSDEAWLIMVGHLDGVAAAYVAWQASGISINDCGPVSDARLAELIEPCLSNEADRRVFLATCKQLASEWRELERNGFEYPPTEN
jgi:hypothetical protein